VAAAILKMAAKTGLMARKSASAMAEILQWR